MKIGDRLTIGDATGEVVAYRALSGGAHVVTLARDAGEITTHTLTPQNGPDTEDGALVRIGTAPPPAEARRLAEAVLAGRTTGSVTRTLQALALAVLAVADDRPTPAPPAPPAHALATREMAEAQGLLARLANYPDRLGAVTRTLRVLVET